MLEKYKKCLICDLKTDLKRDGYSVEVTGACPKECMEFRFDFESELLSLSIFTEAPLLTIYFNHCYVGEAGINEDKPGFLFVVRADRYNSNFRFIHSIIKDEKDLDKAIKMIKEKQKN